MNLTYFSSPSLSYCTNVYPATSWDSILSSISQFSRKVTQSTALPIGLGLWIPARIAEFALRTERVRELVLTCKEAGISVHTLNGFPHGDFHGTVVKEKVFSPDWTTTARVLYTRNLMSIATQTLEAGSELGISTVPISWGEWIQSPKEIEQAALHLISLASDAFFAEKANGVHLHIDLEPEPMGYLSKSSDVVRFFKNFLLPLGTQELQRRWGLSATAAQELILDKIRICYDTCHAAVEYERPANILARYQSLGIQLGRIQISSAPILHLRKGRCLDGKVPSKVFAPYSKDTYLHQVVGFDLDRKPFRFPDLSEALNYLEDQQISGEFRIHMHLPIFMDRVGSLFTTQSHILELVAQNPSCRSWEIETYTWNILPETLKHPTLEAGFVQEINWMHSKFQAIAKTTQAKGEGKSEQELYKISARTGASL